MDFFLLAVRCYEAQIWTIPFLLRCPFIWYPFWLKSTFSFFGQKPWTIVRGLIETNGIVVAEKHTHCI